MDQWIGIYPSDEKVINRTDEDERRVGWAWLDGSEVTWLDWTSGEPSRYEKCARLNEDGRIMGKLCDEEYHFVCKGVSFTST